MTRYLALSILTLATLGCDALTSHTDTVARAGQHELTVDETVDLMADNPRVPARAEVVEQIAGLWVDYTILTSVVAEDSTLAQLDLETLLDPYVEQQTFTRLREQVVTTDTVVSDEELADLYATEGPGIRVKARHILLTPPIGGTDAQRDSVMAVAREVRDRAASGADFDALAREYSEDQGTASQGGDLGWFGRDQMVAPFDSAVFSLQVGQVSDVVETPFGLHIIKLDDREVPALSEIGEDFREQIKNDRRQASLNAYVESVRAGQEMEVRDGAADVIRDLIDDPSKALQGRAASRELLTWDGGEVTVGEVAELFRDMPLPQRTQYETMEDEQLTQLLRELATNELVLADAIDRGITVPQAERDSIAGLIREQVRQLARNAGLTGAPQEGETQAEAVARRVESFLSAVLSGQANVMPLGTLSRALRDQRTWRINEGAVDAVVTRLEERRAEGSVDTTPTAPGPGQAPGQMPTPTPENADTTG